MAGPDTQRKNDAKEAARQQRLAQTLRDNLRRRKDQARAADDPVGTQASGDGAGLSRPAGAL